MENDKHNEPDKRIRAKLDSNELQPDAALWNDIERELDKSKRRGGFFRKRYLLLLLLMFSGIGVFTFQQLGDSDSDTVHTNTINKQNTNNPSSSESNSHQGVSSQSNTTTTASENESANIEQPLNETSVANNNRASNQIVNNQNNTTNSFSANNSTAVSTQSNSNTQTQQESNVQTIDNHQADIAVTQKENSINSTPLETSGNQQNNTAVQTASPDIISENDTNHQAVIANNETIAVTDPQIPIDNSVAIIDSPVDTALALVPLTDTVTKPQENTESTNPLKTKHVVQFYAGPHVQYNSISKKIDVDRNVRPEYLERRRAEEKKTTALSYGLKVGMDLNRLNVQTGIGIRTYVDDIQYENRKLCYDIKNNAPQSLAPSYDTVNIHSEVDNVIAAQNGKTFNRYVEIPLMVGYRIGNKSFFIRPMIGAAIAMPLSWSSNYLSESVDALQNPKDLDWQKPVVFNMLGEIIVSRALSKKLNVDLGFNYNRNLSNIFKQSAGVSQRYSSLGGQLGLTYSF